MNHSLPDPHPQGPVKAVAISPEVEAARLWDIFRAVPVGGGEAGGGEGAIFPVEALTDHIIADTRAADDVQTALVYHYSECLLVQKADLKRERIQVNENIETLQKAIPSKSSITSLLRSGTLPVVSTFRSA